MQGTGNMYEIMNMHWDLYLKHMLIKLYILAEFKYIIYILVLLQKYVQQNIWDGNFSNISDKKVWPNIHDENIWWNIFDENTWQHISDENMLRKYVGKIFWQIFMTRIFRRHISGEIMLTTNYGYLSGDFISVFILLLTPRSPITYSSLAYYYYSLAYYYYYY